MTGESEVIALCRGDFKLGIAILVDVKLVSGDEDGDLWTAGYLFAGGDIIDGDGSGVVDCSGGKLKRLLAILIFGLISLSISTILSVGLVSGLMRRTPSCLSVTLFILEGGGEAVPPPKSRCGGDADGLLGSISKTEVSNPGEEGAT